jgi:hypothetical protein
MNLALPALVVFLVLLPGFVARSGIKRAERLSLDYSPFGQVVTEAVLWAGALHLLWITLTSLIDSQHVFSPGVALRLLASEPLAQARALQAVAAHAPWITAYFVSLLVFATLGPALLRGAITRWRLDRAGSPLSPWLRFSKAPWYYLLSGADFSADAVPDVIAVSAVVDVAGQAVLYTGILEDYFVDPEGNLDRLVLQRVMRRPLTADKNTDLSVDEIEATSSSSSSSSAERGAAARFYPVDGDYFVLRYAEAITLNIEYIKLAEPSGGGTPASA